MLDILRLLVSRVLINRHPLVDRGFGLIYDVERDITWLKDANYARTVGRSRDGQLNWNAAMAWVASLTYRGIGGWRLPTALNPDGSGPCTGNHCDQSEFGHLVFGPWTTDPRSVSYLNFDSFATYWTSTEASATEAFAFEFPNVRQGGLLKDPFNVPDGTIFVPLPGPVLTWPVHDGDVAAMIWQRRLQWILGARPRGIVLFAQLNESISKALAVFRSSPLLGDENVHRALVAQGIESKLAARLVEFLPTAYSRLVLGGSGARFSATFRRMLRGGLSPEKALSSEPVWNAATEFARREAEGGVSREDILAVAGRSPEFDAANQLVEKGSKLENLVFTPLILPWPEGGPDAL